jgi:hypothetical protein
VNHPSFDADDQLLANWGQFFRDMKGSLQDDPNDPLDEELLQRFVRRDLDDETDRYVSWLCGRYREWHEAFLAALEKRDGGSAAE